MRPPRTLSTRRRRRAAALVLTGVTFLGVAGCSGDEDPTATASSQPRALTQTEAERLAVVRFRNFDAGVRSIDLVIPKTGDTDRLHVVGWYDFAEHHGYASVTQGDKGIGVVTGDMAWSPEKIAIVSAPISAPGDAAPVGEIATDGWTTTTFDAGTSILTSALAVIASLGSDRPENASLLQQSDAAHLRTDTVGSASVDVFAGPSGDAASSSGATDEEADGTTASSPAAADGSSATTTVPLEQRIAYWVDATGVALRVDLPLSTTTAVLLLGDADPAALPDLSAIDTVLSGSDAS